jgi:hypothetical protein
VTNNTGAPLTLNAITLALPSPPFSITSIKPALPATVANRKSLKLNIKIQKDEGTTTETVNAPFVNLSLSCGNTLPAGTSNKSRAERSERAERHSIRLEFFDLRGRKLLDQERTEDPWLLLQTHHMRLANGVYLYVVSARAADGKVVRSEVRKLVIQR